MAFTQELSLLLGFFLVSATLFGLPSGESNFTVDEYGKRHYILVPENTNTSFLDELSAKIPGRFSSEHEILDFDDITIDSQSILTPFESVFFFEQETPITAVNSIVDFEFNPNFKIIENDSDLTELEYSKISEPETTIDTSILIERTKTNEDYNFKQLQIGGH